VEGTGVIEARELTKVYGGRTVVDHLTFTVEPGRVTGFLGPNGAGKSTTMRMIIGLAAPTSGTVTVNGRRYRDLPGPLHEVGALLEARAAHTGRCAFDHLLALAQTHGIPRARVHEVIDLVGMADVARQRIGGFSLGMGQRLGIAAALLGDPAVLVLDEPVNGLDPEGIKWIRDLLRHLAGQGRTVLVSSHLMSEMALTADHLIVVGRGRLVADESISSLVARSSRHTVLVRTPQTERLRIVLSEAGGLVRDSGDGGLEITGLDAAHIGGLALAHGVAVHELTPRRASLEEAYMELTADALEYTGTAA
jgi:ABC-2 type transport system ATP-binding protein